MGSEFLTFCVERVHGGGGDASGGTGVDGERHLQTVGQTGGHHVPVLVAAPVQRVRKAQHVPVRLVKRERLVRHATNLETQTGDRMVDQTCYFFQCQYASEM